MEQFETWKIKDHEIEFFDDTHTYICDGIIQPSITQILKVKFSNKYQGISKATLDHASTLGTQMHLAIQEFEEHGIDCELKELRNYKFLKRQYKWECIENETPVILFQDDEPIACGRIDMVGLIDDKMGIFDFKRTSTLDKEYLAYQLNLYRLAYQQCYESEIEFLRGIHLREDVRKFVQIPINEQMAWNLVDEYMKGAKDGNL